MREDTKQMGCLMGALTVWWAWAAGLLVIGTLAYLFVIQPLVLDQTLKNTRHTDEFVRTKQELLVKLAQDYDQLGAEIVTLQKDPSNADVITGKRAQQHAIVDRIKIEASYLQPEQVPPAAARLIG